MRENIAKALAKLSSSNSSFDTTSILMESKDYMLFLIFVTLQVS